MRCLCFTSIVGYNRRPNGYEMMDVMLQARSLSGNGCPVPSGGCLQETDVNRGVFAGVPVRRMVAKKIGE